MKYINNWLWQDKTRTQSTNDDAMLLSQKLAGEPFIISAQKQVKGRGRSGRTWIGLEGNLFFSQGLVFDVKDIGQLIFISSLSLYQTIKVLASPLCKVEIKWPNDILLDNAKVSGTLLEKGNNRYVIIGIGVNICASPAQAEMIYPVTSLKAKGINIDRLSFLRSYIENFDNNYALWQKSGFMPVKTQWLSAVKGLKEEICICNLSEKKQGIFWGIGEQGELLLVQEDKIYPIYAGDVFYMEENK